MQRIVKTTEEVVGLLKVVLGENGVANPFLKVIGDSIAVGSYDIHDEGGRFIDIGYEYEPGKSIFVYDEESSKDWIIWVSAFVTENGDMVFEATDMAGVELGNHPKSQAIANRFQEVIGNQYFFQY